MSSASDRRDKREDPIAFAPKWARDPARNQGLDEWPGSAVGEFPEPNQQSDDVPRLPRSLDPIIMRPPPRAPARRLRAFFVASVIAAGVVAAIMLFVGSGISFEWGNADAPASAATSSRWTFAIKWPNREQRN